MYQIINWSKIVVVAFILCVGIVWKVQPKMFLAFRNVINLQKKKKIVNRLDMHLSWPICNCTELVNIWRNVDRPTSSDKTRLQPRKYPSIMAGCKLTQGWGWKYHIKYKGQDCCTSFLRMQQAYMCHLTVIALWQAYEAMTVSGHLYVRCILRKEVKQSCPLYLSWHFQPPSWPFWQEW